MLFIYWCIFVCFYIKVNNLSTISAEDAKQDEVEIPFPSIFLQSNYNRGAEFHIVSENIKGSSTRYTTEEYIYAEKGYEFVTTQNQHGEVSTLIDGKRDLIYRFQPFTCVQSKSTDATLPNLGFRGKWVYDYAFEEGDYNVKTLKVFGVAAIWMHASLAEKKFIKADRIYSAIEDRVVPSYRWTMSDDELKMDIHLYFRVPSESENLLTMPLELIQFEDHSTKEIVHTINIISVRFYLKKTEEKKFIVPIGYGCPTPSMDEQFLSHYSLLEDNYKIDMEVTATSFDHGQDGLITKDTDIVSVQIGKVFLYDTHKLDEIESKFEQQLLLLNTKGRSGNLNLNNNKYVTDLKTGVRYAIDTNTNECEMIKIASDQINQTPIRFSNELVLDVNQFTLQDILEDIKNFNFISEERQLYDDVYTIIFEKTGSNMAAKPSSIIRIYQKAPGAEPRLDRVLMYIYNKERSTIEAAYNFEILDHVRLSSRYEMAQLFDISDCYADKKSHAWINVKYPVSSKLSSVLSRDIYNLKNFLYERYSFNLKLDFIQMPQLEIIFDSYFMIIRAKLLDAPSKLYQYEAQRNKDFLMVGTDRLDRAADEQQCSDLCKLYSCQTFSFCQQYACKLTSRSLVTKSPNLDTPPGVDNIALILVNSNKCTLYTNGNLEKTNGRQSVCLQEILSQLQHDNYQDYSLPPTPEELLPGPNGELFGDNEARSNALSEYAAQVALYMYKYDTPVTTILLEMENILVILTPSEFAIEQDPMAELFPSDMSHDETSLLPHKPKFYHAQMERRFKVTVDKDTLILADQSYEQCSLLCVDRNCLSLSYCQFEKQCIVTNIQDTETIMRSSLLDPDCFIAQRDFLGKFTKFQNVGRPMSYKVEREALDERHCAHMCVSETEFKCLSFDYCLSQNHNQHPIKVKDFTPSTYVEAKPACLLQEARDWDMQASEFRKRLINNVQVRASKKGQLLPEQQMSTNNNNNKITGCDHYARSILADFVRLDSRKFKDDTFYKAQLEVYSGLDVEKCAQVCIEQESDCSSFEFCYFSKSPSLAKQSCTIARGKIFESVQKNATSMSNMFDTSDECGVYSLSKDALSRNSFDNMLDLDDDNNSSNQKQQQQPGDYRSNQLSNSALACIMISGFTLSLLLGIGIVVVPQYRDPLQRRINRIIDLRRANI